MKFIGNSLRKRCNERGGVRQWAIRFENERTNVHDKEWKTEYCE